MLQSEPFDLGLVLYLRTCLAQFLLNNQKRISVEGMNLLELYSSLAKLKDYLNFEEYVDKNVQEIKSEVDILGLWCIPVIMRVPVKVVKLDEEGVYAKEYFASLGDP